MKCIVLKALWVTSVLGNTAFESMQFFSPQYNVHVQCMIYQIFAYLRLSSFCEFVPESLSSHFVIFCNEKFQQRVYFFILI